MTIDDQQPIRFTPAAVKAIKEARSEQGEPNDGIRVAVVGGGCSGYRYSMGFENEERSGDRAWIVDELRIFIDPISTTLLKGTEIDYLDDEATGVGFQFNNPNPHQSCSCGSAH